MIHKKQREELRKVLGYHYADEVLYILNMHGVTSRKGTPYGKSMIRNVYNGLNENKKIESAIMELYVKKKKEKEETFNTRNEVLGIPDEK